LRRPVRSAAQAEPFPLRKPSEQERADSPGSERGSAMLNKQQLLELVVQRPDRSSVDIRFINAIWDACMRWCLEAFKEQTGVKFLGLGEFCFRKDTIGHMEFWNPMFIVSESFARSHGLHDRRPKTHASETASVDIDMSKVAQMTTDSLGEVVGRETVDSALRDVVDRIGEVCSDERQGIIVIDFDFGKLMCENKSLEFHYAGDDKGKPPKTSGSHGGSRRAAPPATAASDGDSMGLEGSKLPMRAPLQRPYVRHLRPAEQPTEADVLHSHHDQIDRKQFLAGVARETEAAQHVEMLQRLRGEMLVDYDLREQRRSVNRELADQLKTQNMEKRERDVEARQVHGMNHWPFRTEDEVRHSVALTNMKQKEDLDRQLKEKAEKRAFLESVMKKQQMAEDEASARATQLARDEARHRQQTMAATQQSVERTMDDAYRRYEDYLDKRKGAIDTSKAYVKEQRYLSEQGERLKEEETRRRVADMKSYLDGQIADKRTKSQMTKALERTEVPINDPTTLPAGTEIDPDEEQFVKMALRRALDNQVAAKEVERKNIHEEDLSQQKQILNCVAHEMKQARFRDLTLRNDRREMLNGTWQKQQQLRNTELALDKAAS